MKSKWAWLNAVWALAIVLFASAARAQSRPMPADFVPPQLRDVEIEDKRGARLPLDASLIDHEGQSVKLSTYLPGDKPAIVVLAYYGCPMLCSLVLNALSQGIKDLAWTAGKEYRVVTVSFDPRDKAEVAKQKRAGYVESYGRRVSERGWDFLIGDEATVKRLADAVGFRYRWDPQTEQYAHAAGVFIVMPDGRLSNTLQGLQFDGPKLRMALTEASDGKLGTAWDRFKTLCFQYDPNSHSYVMSAKKIMKWVGLAMLIGVVVWLHRLWRRDGTRGGSGRLGLAGQKSKEAR